MIHLTKLRLCGFKSFVDPTELLIAPGMTGVVGPNGCGKSNLVEALRWVMGETSARQMRGGEMDDVIFGGTTHRPAYNRADVTVSLDNTAHMAPLPFADVTEIDVTRRIERGQGSGYRFNGKPVRAKDVHLLFADAATGARSTAMVSQGRVGALINDKPAQRRVLLEEAAGIGGLHTRRHEAELRLRAAESNLERSSDVIGALETQLTSLRRQARQAQRYRRLSDAIRATEAQVLYRRWDSARESLTRARTQLHQANQALSSLSGQAAAATAEHRAATDALPVLREADAKAGARLQRLRITGEQLADEEQRLVAQRHQAEQRLQQVVEDRDREATRLADAEEALRALRAERRGLERDGDGADERDGAARERVETLAGQVDADDHRLASLTDRLAHEQATWQAAERRVEDARSRHRQVQSRLAKAQDVLTREGETAGHGDSLDLAREAVDAAALAVHEARESADDADRRADDGRLAHDAARDHWQGVAARRTRLRADVEALTALHAEVAGDWTPVLNGISVVEGYEQALAAALGDDLFVAEDGEAPVHWRPIALPSASPSLPSGVVPLIDVVTAPAALHSRLAQIGVVGDAQTGDALRRDLAVGQRLVTRDGALWRWDGLTAAAEAPSAAAIRLRQKNRLEHLRLDLAVADRVVEEAEQETDTARRCSEEALAVARRARDDVRAMEATLAAAQTALDAHQRRVREIQSRWASAQAQVEQLTHDFEETRRDLETAERTYLDTPEGSATRQAIEALRTVLGDRRRDLFDARSELDRGVRDAANRHHRIKRIDGEMEDWEQRVRGALSQRAQWEERHRESQREVDGLAEKPQEIAEQRLHLLDLIEEAEEARKTTADALAEGETRRAKADNALREAEKSLGTLREERVRAEATVEQCAAAVHQGATAIAERLDCTPSEARMLAEQESLAESSARDRGAVGGDPNGEAARTEPSSTAPSAAIHPLSVQDLETRLLRLIRDREAMGPVNLRAEAEAADLEGQMTTLVRERDDLVAAITRLRQGISDLNREGRHRLVSAFEQVDAQFRRLFARLFGGGRAHLALSDHDDPLHAGLEIFASPPGKRLQSLSLLSGGEQAMTAIALLFAVFLVNPAPICVLDEVDAPLDDANVDRFCSLLSELARTPSAHGEGTHGGNGGTRFLVITHHRMTMARMDRLYGVTMAERGVSKLVSVDLRQAEGMRDTEDHTRKKPQVSLS